MDYISELQEHWYEPSFWTKRAAPYAYRRIKDTAVKPPINKLYDTLVEVRYDGYYDVMGEDWDNLIILDACRYDVLQEREDELPGKLDFRYSSGGHTGGFLRGQFQGESFLDTVYVSSNPHVSRIVPDAFFDRRQVWATHWNDEMSVVLPADMREQTLIMAEKYPNKRLISHFVQPHQPYISEWAKEKLNLPFGLEGARCLATGQFESMDEIDRESMTTYLHLFREGEIDRDTIWKAYEKNVEEVLPKVIKLVDELSGRTVITADHGELFKERTFPYFSEFVGHRSDIRSQHLNRVPWIVVEGERRKIELGKDSQNDDNLNEQEVEKRLMNLGYIEDD